MMFQYRRAYGVLLGLLVCSMCSLSFAKPQVTDYLGRTVTLERPAQRVIAVAPHIVENLASAGGLSAIVGAVEYCDYPPQAKSIPRVGSISQFSLESIIALKPDLVVVWMSTKGADIMVQLEALGIATYASDPHKLEDVAKSIRDYGILLGTETIANQQADAFLARLNGLKKQFANQRSVSVLYQVWFDPLQTINDEHIISDVIKLCGGRNAFGDLPGLAPKISVESVITRDPQTIVASGMGEARPDWLDLWLKWPNLKAVKRRNLYFIPPDIIQRHTMRLLDGAQRLCDQLQDARDKNS